MCCLIWFMKSNYSLPKLDLKKSQKKKHVKESVKNIREKRKKYTKQNTKIYPRKIFQANKEIYYS